MKAASSGLIALLLTGSFVRADLYTLTLSDGSVLRYTTADCDITTSIDIFEEADIFATADIFAGTSWSAHGPQLDASTDRALGTWTTGLDVGTWQVKVMPRLEDPISGETFPDKIGDIPWAAAAAGGALDGAEVLVERAYLAEWPTPYRRSVAMLDSYKIVMFAGRMAEVDIGRSYVILNANDWRELLTISMPRNLFQSGCRYTLFDTGCTLSAAAFVESDSVLAISAAGNAITANLGDPTGYYDLGRIVMTSGMNAGFSRQIRSWDLGTHVLKMIAPFYFDVEVGDTFDVYPGCDKTQVTCAGTFGNLLNFGGQPNIPAPETAV